MMLRALLVLCLSCVGTNLRAADDADYLPAEPDLKIVRLDSSPDESFLSVRLDTLGRMFVGGREALFVYEPQADGTYAARQELYRFPADTWINDIAIRGHDIYVATVAAIYVLPGAVTKREGVKAERLLWGVPLGHVHQCFHGLAFGPEGDLYISMGDPLWYYGDFTRPDHWGHWSFFYKPSGEEQEATTEVNGRRWARTPYNGVGGVFRIRPDGSRFRVVARGLRNSCGLVFDHDWNLFTNDNDHEGMPAEYVPGRLLHVVPHAYYSWPRGWLKSKSPERADLLDTLNDNLGRFVPVGQAYYDEDFLPPRFRHNLLVARWCIKSVTRYPLKEHGATFKAEELDLLDGQDQARPVGVSVGRGGRIFATICYMAQNEGSPVYKSDIVMITRKDDPSTAPFEAYDITTRSEKDLYLDLASRSWQRRYAATVELQRRGKPADPPVAQVLTAGPAARLRALLDLFDEEGPASFDDVITTAGSEDSYLRHVACMFLAERAPRTVLADMLKAGDRRRRLAGVLATGFRLTLPTTDAAVPPGCQLDKLQSETAYTVQYASEQIDLRSLGPVGNYTVADHWKQGTPSDDQQRLFEMLLASTRDADRGVRLQAAYFLSLLNDPRSEPVVNKVVTADQERRLNIARLSNVTTAWLVGPFDDGDQGFSRKHAPQEGAVDLAAKYTEGDQELSWQQQQTQRQFDLAALYGNVDRRSVYAYFRMESGQKQRAHLLLGSDDGIEAWHNGRQIWSNDVERGALPYQDTVVLELQPGSNDILLRVRNRTGASQLYISYRALAEVAIVLPDKVEGPSLAERLATAGGGDYKIPPEFLERDWKQAVTQGNPEQGRKLFESMGCAKCHAISAEAAGMGGPSLADAAKRFTVPYLVESVLAPNRQISPVFRATQVITSDGRPLVGLLIAETADRIELLLPDTKKVVIEKKDIEQRALQNLSPMPQGIVKQPEELQDLISYLLQGRHPREGGDPVAREQKHE